MAGDSDDDVAANLVVAKDFLLAVARDLEVVGWMVDWSEISQVEHLVCFEAAKKGSTMAAQ